MPEQRVRIIPRIHGKRTRDGKVSEPDIHWIVEKWLERHPEVKGREQEIRVLSGRWHTGWVGNRGRQCFHASLQGTRGLRPCHRRRLVRILSCRRMAR